MRRSTANKSLLLAIAFSGLISCGGAQFSGSTGIKKIERPTPYEPTVKEITASSSADAEYSLSCVDLDSGTSRFSVNSAKGKKVQIKGEICHDSEVPSFGEEATIIFVLDFSGSMDDNDPYENGTCGRYEAVSAILSKVGADKFQGTGIKSGIVGFGSDGEVVEGIKSAKSVFENITPSQLCSSGSNGTNYQAAFTTASSLIAGIDGKKVVYFISDGLPTSNVNPADIIDIINGGPLPDNGSAEQVGEEAAKELRTNNSNLVLNAVYLNKDGGNNSKDYLAKITGDAKRVKIVVNADQLAEEIVEFRDLPSRVLGDLVSANILVNATGFETQGVELEYFRKVSGRTGVWEFKSKPFSVNSKTGTVVSNEVNILAAAENGGMKKFSLTVDAQSK